MVLVKLKKMSCEENLILVCIHNSLVLFNNSISWLYYMTLSFVGTGRFINISVDNYSTQPLLMNSNNKLQDEDEDEDEDCDDAEEDSKELQKPVNSIVSAYRLLTPSVKVSSFF